MVAERKKKSTLNPVNRLLKELEEIAKKKNRIYKVARSDQSTTTAVKRQS